MCYNEFLGQASCHLQPRLDAITDDELKKGCERLGDYMPSYMERSLSGGAHFVWVLEEPVTVPSRDFAIALLKHIEKQIPLKMLCVGFDAGAVERGDSFIVLQGDRRHGHEFRAEVAARGAAGALVGRPVEGLPVEFGLIQTEVP